MDKSTEATQTQSPDMFYILLTPVLTGSFLHHFGTLDANVNMHAIEHTNMLKTHEGRGRKGKDERSAVSLSEFSVISMGVKFKD